GQDQRAWNHQASGPKSGGDGPVLHQGVPAGGRKGFDRRIWHLQGGSEKGQGRQEPQDRRQHHHSAQDGPCVQAGTTAPQGSQSREGSWSSGRSLMPQAPASAAQRKLFYSIGDVARHTGVRPHVLRYWESEFREIAPKKAPNGKRLYRERDIEAIETVKALLYGQKFTVEGARRALKKGRGGN